VVAAAAVVAVERAVAPVGAEALAAEAPAAEAPAAVEVAEVVGAVAEARAAAGTGAEVEVEVAEGVEVGAAAEPGAAALCQSRRRRTAPPRAPAQPSPRHRLPERRSRSRRLRRR
jgi:hypothetical protein